MFKFRGPWPTFEEFCKGFEEFEKVVEKKRKENFRQMSGGTLKEKK